MKFRPCIDIHNGAVKQIVGGSLKDAGNAAVENYISRQDADYYATMYKKDGLTGGHIILLNPPASEYYDATKAQALKALHAYPGGDRRRNYCRKCCRVSGRRGKSCDRYILCISEWTGAV